MHEQRVKSSARRQIPAVGRILDALGQRDLAPPSDLPRSVVVDLIRRKLSQIRAASDIPEFESIVADLRRSVDEFRASRLGPVINGTGIVIHTNFGRAPLASEAMRALNEIGSGYSNLEYDLATGARGERGAYVEHALALLCGAEAATVVNNCAAALVLIVRHFIQLKRELDCLKQSSLHLGKSDVIISRGELVQIGGGFRIGEILEATGAKLREVGATNKTTLEDYARAIGSETAMILKVHRSNFFMSGFVESPSSEEIGALARKKRIVFVEDLGSGAIIATEEFGIADHEPTPAEAMKAGADLVCFSGDKLFGGPQAGIIVGKKRFVTALKREPLFRALRCDKLCLAALQATVDLHLDQRTAGIPALALLQISEDELHARAAAICSRLQGLPLKIAIGCGGAKAGGGTLPKSSMRSVTIDIVPQTSSLTDFAATLRAWNPPVIGYIADGRFKLDLRTIFPHQDNLVVEAVRVACADKA
ncbi:MAG: L-seryl-tRNA(Sec) selenium transferase [Verrucomicrobia bacterium]|nr:MAG: L-seryl-tRNA(Sec) selenium transferase [Verrucomicrobiota bacterium]